MTGRLGIDDVTPAVGDGRQPGKAVVGEVFPVGATVLREGHDAHRRDVVLEEGRQRRPGPAHPDGARAATRRPVAADRRPGRAGPVDASGWRLERPVGDLAHAVTVKLGRQGPDSASELEEGARLLQRVGRGPPSAPDRDLLFGAAQRAARHRAAAAAASRPRSSPRSHDDHGRAPAARADHPRPAATRSTSTATRALFGSWYEFFPRSTGGRDDATAARCTARSPPRPSGSTASPRWASTWSTCRRSTRSAPSPQGPEQHRSRPRPSPATSARRGRSGRPRAATTRSTPSWALRRLRRVRRAAPGTSGMEVALDFALQAARTTRGCRRTRSGSPCAPTGRSPTRRTRRRSTRTSTRSTSTTTPRASTPRSLRDRAAVGGARACGSSGWTTRTPSRRTSGSG